MRKGNAALALYYLDVTAVCRVSNFDCPSQIGGYSLQILGLLLILAFVELGGDPERNLAPPHRDS
jgi:hypothetical protein